MNGELAPIADMLAHLEYCKQTQRWREGFIPDPSTYLNQGRWTDCYEVEQVKPEIMSCSWPGCSKEVVMGDKATGNGNACYEHLEAIKRGENKVRSV